MVVESAHAAPVSAIAAPIRNAFNAPLNLRQIECADFVVLFFMANS